MRLNRRHIVSLLFVSPQPSQEANGHGTAEELVGQSAGNRSQTAAAETESLAVVSPSRPNHELRRSCS